jgi:ATP-dependent helicase/nuclease subunit A
LARVPLEAGVPPGFDVADDAARLELVAAAWREALARDPHADVALATLSRRIDAQTFEALLMSVAADRTRFTALNPDGDAACAAIARRHRVDRSADDVATAAMADVDWASLKEFAAVLADGSSADVASGRRVERALGERTFEAYAAIFVKDNGEPCAHLPTAKTAKAAPFFKQFCDRERVRLQPLMQELLAIERADEARALVRLAYALGGAFEAAKARRAVLDFDDLIVHAERLLTRADAAAWVLYKLDGGIDHILVDEGQDTSPAQWRLIEPLQLEFFGGAGVRTAQRTVFAVGDHKQSIYGFQGADPDHFLNEAQKLEARARAAGAEFVAPSLDMSFRSAPEVLKAVDATFADLRLARAEPSASDLIRHVARREHEVGRVEFWPIAPRPDKPEAEPWDAPMDSETESTAPAILARTLARAVRGWIENGEGVWDKGALRPMQAGDVLALVRSRGALFSQLIKAFKRENLPVAGADRLVLREEIAILDLLAAARVALDPTDDLSLAALLKSPLIGLTDDDAHIFPLAFGRRSGERLIDRLRGTDDGVYSAAKATIDGVIASGSAHPHAFFSALLERTDASGQSGWARMLARLGSESRDPLEEFLSRALEIGRSGAATLQRFVHVVESDTTDVKRELEQSGGAVRVMTVHGAKGLEAPVVLLPETTGGLRSDTSRGEFLWRGDGPVICAAKDRDDPIAAAARAEAEQASLREHLRLLYVAMTRARDRLIVCGAFRGPANGKGLEANNWWEIVGAGMDRAEAEIIPTPFGKGRALGQRLTATTTDARRTEIATTAPDWARRAVATLPPRAPPFAGPVFSPRDGGRARFRRGLMIHGLLQRLPEIARDRRAQSGAIWLARQSVPTQEAEALLSEALAVLDAPELDHVFGPHSRAETPIVARGADGEAIRGVIDRLVVTSDEIVVLDYKTDRPPPDRVDDTPPRILKQLARYAYAVAQAFPGRRVRTVIVWTETPRVVIVPDALLRAGFSDC